MHSATSQHETANTQPAIPAYQSNSDSRGAACNGCRPKQCVVRPPLAAHRLRTLALGFELLLGKKFGDFASFGFAVGFGRFRAGGSRRGSETFQLLVDVLVEVRIHLAGIFVRRNRWQLGRACLGLPFESGEDPSGLDLKLIVSTSLTLPTYTINIPKSWSPTTYYERPAMFKIITYARSYLITSDRSSVAF